MTPETQAPAAETELVANSQRDALRSATPINLVLTVALVAALTVDLWQGFDIGDPATVVLLATAAWMSESFAALVQRFSSVSLVSTLVGVATVLCGPLGASIVGLSCGLCLGRWPLPVRFFNALMSGVMGAVGGLTFNHFVGDGAGRLVWVRDNIGSLILPIAVTTLVMLLVNALLVGLVIRVTAGVPFSRSLRDFGEHGVGLFLAGGLISYLVVVLWIGAKVGPLTILVMAPPLLLVQWASAATVAEASSADHAVDALVASLELNRPGTRAHGDLVAAIAEGIANLSGLSDDEVHQVRRAARLHHLGTITISDPGRAELDVAVARRGAQLMEGVEFLASVRRIVATQSDAAIDTAPPAQVLAAAELLADSLEKDRPQVNAATHAWVEQHISLIADHPDLAPTLRTAMQTLPRTPLPDQLLVRHFSDVGPRSPGRGAT